MLSFFCTGCVPVLKDEVHPCLFLQVGGSGEEWEGLSSLMPSSATLIVPTAEQAPVALFGNQVCPSWSVQPPGLGWILGKDEEMLALIVKRRPYFDKVLKLKHLMMKYPQQNLASKYAVCSIFTYFVVGSTCMTLIQVMWQS